MRPSVLPLLALAALLFLCPSVPAASDDPDDNTVPRSGVWPLDPVPGIVRGFDPPDVPWGSGHRGVDLAGTVGQAVRSSLPGTVTYAGRLAGRGVVVVSHGDTRTTYEPVAAAVSVGDQVAAGDRLGRLELPGSHCFPSAWTRSRLVRPPLLPTLTSPSHWVFQWMSNRQEAVRGRQLQAGVMTCLHWGWIRNVDNVYLDPLQLVETARPVRLLPLWRDMPLTARTTSLLQSYSPSPLCHPS